MLGRGGKWRGFALAIILVGALQGAWAVEFSDVCATLTQKPVASGNFLQTKTLAASGRTLKSSGTFVFAPAGVAWLTEAPIKNSLIITSSTVTKINKAGKKTVTPTAKSPAFSGVAAILSTILSGDEAVIKSAFEIAFSGEDEKVWSAKLTARDETLKAALSDITLTGDKATLSFTQISIEQANGDGVVYDFSKTVQSEELSDEQKRLFE